MDFRVTANNRSLKTRVFDFFRYFFRFPVIENLIVWLKGKSAVFAKLAPNYYQYKPNSFRYFTRAGIRYRTDISDWLGYCAYFNVKNDPYYSLFSLVKKDMVIIDIGSNIGFTALNMAAMAGDGGMVYAFEPDRNNYMFLENNIGMNKKLHVKTFQLGIGNVAGKFKLAIHNESNRGENKIMYSPTDENYSLIDMVRLDDFALEKNIIKIDIIKIDTEGFELNVLKGAEKTILSCKPVIFIEIDDENLKEQKSYAKEVVAYIKAAGYFITSAQSGKIIEINDDFSNCHFDAICKAITG